MRFPRQARRAAKKAAPAECYQETGARDGQDIRAAVPIWNRTREGSEKPDLEHLRRAGILSGKYGKGFNESPGFPGAPVIGAMTVAQLKESIASSRNSIATNHPYCWMRTDRTPVPAPCLMRMQPQLASQDDLFAAPQPGPDGFIYQPAFIEPGEEAALLEIFKGLPFRETPYKEYIARRRTVSYGGDYNPGTDENHSIGAIPDFLLPLRERFGAWAGLPAEGFVQALVSEYRPNTPLGWHRDMPDYEAIVGLSLGAPCRMRFRPYRPGEKIHRSEVLSLNLMPRSAYRMHGAARWKWQHSIAPTTRLRYSVTFRTARAKS